MERTVWVKVDDLDILLACFEACAARSSIKAWCEEVQNDPDDLDAAETRLRDAVGMCQ